MDHYDNIASAGCRRKSNRIAGGRFSMRLSVRLPYLLFFFMLFLPGCSPKVIERVVYQHDTTTVHHRDSVFFRDSIYVKEWLKGDTVYIEKIKDRYIYKDRWRDSIKIVRDSVAVETIKEVKVEKPLSWWQKARIGAFWWLVVALGAALSWIFRKPLLSLFGKLI